MNRLLTLPEAAAELRCSPRTLRRRIADGALPVVADGRRILVRRVDLDAYVVRRIEQRVPASRGAPTSATFAPAAGSRWWD